MPDEGGTTHVRIHMMLACAGALSSLTAVNGSTTNDGGEGSRVSGECVAQGPRMVRDVFRLAKENAPAIIFIDEVDAIATARFDAQTGADRSAFPSTVPVQLD